MARQTWIANSTSRFTQRLLRSIRRKRDNNTSEFLHYRYATQETNLSPRHIALERNLKRFAQRAVTAQAGIRPTRTNQTQLTRLRCRTSKKSWSKFQQHEGNQNIRLHKLLPERDGGRDISFLFKRQGQEEKLTRTDAHACFASFSSGQWGGSTHTQHHPKVELCTLIPPMLLRRARAFTPTHPKNPPPALVIQRVLDSSSQDMRAEQSTSTCHVLRSLEHKGLQSGRMGRQARSNTCLMPMRHSEGHDKGDLPIISTPE